jgi:hypothetical protein
MWLALGIWNKAGDEKNKGLKVDIKPHSPIFSLEHPGPVI